MLGGLTNDDLGKTVFLTYVLVRRLSEKKTTIYCSEGHRAFLFEDSGVTSLSIIQSHLDIPVLRDQPTCWALVNLSPHLEEPPRQFGPKTRMGRVVIASSPNIKHFAIYHEHPGLQRYMPTWSWDEIYLAKFVIASLVCM